MKNHTQNMAVVIGQNIIPQQGQTAENPIVINLPPVDPNHEREKIQKYFPKRVMLLLSILQIVCGGLVFLIQVWAIKFILEIINIFF